MRRQTLTTIIRNKSWELKEYRNGSENFETIHSISLKTGRLVLNRPYGCQHDARNSCVQKRCDIVIYALKSVVGGPVLPLPYCDYRDMFKLELTCDERICEGYASITNTTHCTNQRYAILVGYGTKTWDNPAFILQGIYLLMLFKDSATLAHVCLNNSFMKFGSFAKKNI